MAYTVYITRHSAASGVEEAGGQEIALAEWQQYVAGDPEMRLNDYANDLEYADGDPGYRQYLEGLAAWLGNAPDGPGHEHAWFSYQGGEVVAENPDADTVRKAYAIARALGAQVSDDEGRLKVVELAPPPIPATAPPDASRPSEELPNEDMTASMEATDFRNFQTYGSAEAAQPLLAALGRAGIAYRTTFDTGRMAFDPSFANNQLSRNFLVQLPLADFERGTALMSDLNQRALEGLDADHYLFKFSDEELLDMLVKPDEWSALDVAMAGQLLRQRGRDVSPDTLRLLRQRRTAELAQPDADHRAWVLSGYTSALLGGFLGFIIGYHLYSSRKQLPDGRRLYSFSARDRVHGLRIIALGSAVFVLLLVVRLLHLAD